MAMTKMTRNGSQADILPMAMQPTMPTQTQSMKMGFLKPFVSARVPRIGLRIAVMMVTTEVA